MRDALGHMGVTFLEAERGAEPVAEDGEFPLLVTTPARARALSDGDRKPRHHLHLVVAEHGGDIEAESPGPGQGATFRVRLPLSDTCQENQNQYQAA